MAIFGFLEGNSKKKWSEDDCFMVGQKLAQFHLANIDNKLKDKYLVFILFFYIYNKT